MSRGVQDSMGTKAASAIWPYGGVHGWPADLVAARPGSRSGHRLAHVPPGNGGLCYLVVVQRGTAVAV